MVSVRHDGIASVAGTLRPKGRQSGVGGQAGQISPGASGIVWQAPLLTLQGLPGNETTSTPTRVRQFLKKGVVKFQEVRRAVPMSMICKRRPEVCTLATSVCWDVHILAAGLVLGYVEGNQYADDKKQLRRQRDATEAHGQPRLP